MSERQNPTKTAFFFGESSDMRTTVDSVCQGPNARNPSTFGALGLKFGWLGSRARAWLMQRLTLTPSQTLTPACWAKDPEPSLRLDLRPFTIELDLAQHTAYTYNDIGASASITQTGHTIQNCTRYRQATLRRQPSRSAPPPWLHRHITSLRPSSAIPYAP